MLAASECQGAELGILVSSTQGVKIITLTGSLRLVPHDQNTGGFFVCVLEKGSDAIIEDPSTDLPEVPALDDVAVADEGGSSRLKRSGTPSGIEGSEADAKRVKADTEGPAVDAEVSEVKEEQAVAPKVEKKAGPSKQKKVKRDLSFREDPYSFIKPDHVEVGSVV